MEVTVLAMMSMMPVVLMGMRMVMTMERMMTREAMATMISLRQVLLLTGQVLVLLVSSTEVVAEGQAQEEGENVKELMHDEDCCRGPAA